MTGAAVRLLAVEGEAHGRDLPVEPWVIGLGTFVVLCALLAITMTFGKDR